MSNRSLIALSILATVGVLGCGTADVTGDVAKDATRHNKLMTWEEFNSVIFQEPGTGVYITDGDETIVGEKNLREYFDTKIAIAADETPTTVQQPLIVDTVNGQDDKWSATQRHTLTYCVNKSAFGTHYAAVVQAMVDATAEWTNSCDVQWQHLSAQDTNCTASNSSVLFDVNPVNVNGQYIARSFFPSTARSDRNILIDNSAFTSSGDPTLTGVLRHELGHTIGFRHEHTRPEAGTCFEDNNWRALTPYDQASVMHYPQCNGISSWALVLTAYDRQGCASLYGAGGTTCTPSCSGKSCGDDGCGGSCGTCASGKTCNTSGQCVSTCTPSCSGKSCGDDGCGGSCGTCASGKTCNTSGQCVSTCTPSCSGKSCGDDGCGGSCGTCSSGQTCSAAGQCQSGTPGGTTTETASGTVAKNGAKYFGPYAVVAGTNFSVDMTGTGDADLYVRFGAKPTTATYDCRPYLDGSAESCSLDVPAGQSTAYIMVRGYAASTFNLTITYTKAGGTPTPDPGPSGTPKTVTLTGTVATGASVNESPIAVLAGTTFQVVMSGTGDPDLYVRFGAKPTASTYNCRPYLDGPNETCSITVPAGQSQAYIMVNGYAAASFTLNVSYTAP